MQKREVIKKIVEKTGIPYAQIERTINTFLETVLDETMANNEVIRLNGFGFFKSHISPSGIKYNLNTGEKFKTLPVKKLVFYSSKITRRKLTD